MERPKFYWHANTSSGGTLSLGLDILGKYSKKDVEQQLAYAIDECRKRMEANGFIPATAKLMSSRDIAHEYGNTRQYWEKLLSEGKIKYRETSAGRITTNLWVTGYLNNRDKVNGYVKNVHEVLARIGESKRSHGSVLCPVCGEHRFEYATSFDVYANGICRACGFYVHTTP